MEKLFSAFLKIVGIVTGIIWCLLVIPLYFFAESDIVWSIFSGFLLPFVCLVFGFYAIHKNFRRSMRSFMIAVLGGMLVRLLFIGVMFVIVIKITNLNILAFTLSLFGFYVLYMALELIFINCNAR